MKKWICIVLLAILTVSIAQLPTEAAEMPHYALESKSVQAGETFCLNVAIADNPGIISLRLKIRYDAEALELVGAEDLGLLSGFTTPSPVIASPYTLRWADSLATVNNTAQGAFVTLTFRARKANTTADIAILHEEARTADGTKVAFTNASATVSIGGNALRGDFDQSGTVTDGDALYLLRHTLFEDRYPISQSGDVDGDGKVTDADALYLLRYTLFPDRYPLQSL